MDTVMGSDESVLFTPGPVMTDPRVKQAAGGADIGHRRPEFEKILENVRANVRRIYRADASYSVAVVTGSGTAANELVINSLNVGRVLVVTNGEFGERLERMLEHYDIPHDTLAYAWGDHPNVNEIATHLRRDERIDLVAMVYHETSTGMINPVPAVGEVCDAEGVYLFADTISAVGGESIDVLEQGIHVATGVGNKAVGALPGVSFVCIAAPALQHIIGEARTMYLDLKKHLRYAEERSQTPNTPAVSSIRALDTALELLLEETLDARIERYETCAALLRQRFSKLEGFRLLLPAEESSNTVTSVLLPPGVSLSTFVESLDRNGYLVYPGKGRLFERNLFQACNMGEISPEMCEAFVATVEGLVQTDSAR